MSTLPWKITCSMTNLYRICRNFMKSISQRHLQNQWPGIFSQTKKQIISMTSLKETKNGSIEYSRRKRPLKRRLNVERRRISRFIQRSISLARACMKKRWECWKFCTKVDNSSSCKQIQASSWLHIDQILEYQANLVRMNYQDRCHMKVMNEIMSIQTK